MIWKKEKMVRIGLNKRNFFFFYVTWSCGFSVCVLVFFFVVVVCLFGCVFFYTEDGFFLNLLFV